MKSKLLIMLLSLFCLSTKADGAKAHLLIWAKDKSMAVYPLADKPKMTFTETSLVITYKGAETAYPLDDMVRFTYEDETAMGLLGCDTALLKQLETTEETITSLYGDVAAQFTKSISTLQERIGDLKRGVVEDLAAGKLDKPARLAEVNTISSEIDQLLTDAPAAQKAYEEQQAELQRKAANQAAFDALTAKLDTLQQRLDAAETTIATDDKDVAGQFTDALAAINEKISAQRANLKRQYDAVELTADSQLDMKAVKAIEDSIEKLLSDAAAAQKTYEEQQADLQKKAANQAAFEALTAELDALQQKLDAAETTVATDDKDVAARFKGAITARNVEIDALRIYLKQKYDAVELAEASQLVADRLKEIEDSIEKLLTDAAAAQKAFEEEQAELQKKAANQAAFETLTAELDALQQRLDAAETTIATNDKDVAAQFTDAITTINEQISAQRANLKRQYDAVELTADSQLDMKAVKAIEDSIEKLLSDAAAAQKTYEEQQADLQKKAANQAAFEALTAELDALQQKLDAAETTVATDDKDVAARFKGAITARNVEIDALRIYLKQKYDAVELAEASQLVADRLKEIEDSIEKLLTDAAAAQKAFEEEQAELQKKAANQAAFDALTSKLDTLQQSLNSAKSIIVAMRLENYSEFVPRISNIQFMIDDLRTELKKLYEAIELNADSKLDQNRVKAIEAAIKQLLEDARKEATEIKGVADLQTEASPFKFDGSVLFFPALKANSTVSVYTLNGTLVFKKTVHQNGEYAFPLSNLNAGIYMVNVNGLTYKIVKK